MLNCKIFSFAIYVMEEVLPQKCKKLHTCTSCQHLGLVWKTASFND
jgi:hypothetical protein